MVGFMRQDYFKLRRLKRVWRKPKGRQSKLRVKKSGSGLVVKIGYKKHGSVQRTVVSSVGELQRAAATEVLIAAGVGSKKAAAMAAAAQERGVRILNMKKVARAGRIARSLERRKQPAPKKEAVKE